MTVSNLNVRHCTDRGKKPFAFLVLNERVTETT